MDASCPHMKRPGTVLSDNCGQAESAGILLPRYSNLSPVRYTGTLCIKIVRLLIKMGFFRDKAAIREKKSSG